MSAILPQQDIIISFPPSNINVIDEQSKSRNLDQFYTNEKVAKDCMDFLNKHFNLKDYFLLEPSAGTGSFSDFFHKRSIAFDLEPKRAYINTADFLALDLNFLKNEKVFTIGNPPFGKNSSLAIKFFNKAAAISDFIAFIVPKTFKKVSVTNKLDMGFTKVYEFEIPLDSFVFNGVAYAVPCVFQVWKKSAIKRKKIETKSTSALFEFVDRNSSDFAIRRVGGLAGKVIEDFEAYQDSSHYFIKAKVGKEFLKTQLENLYPSFNTQAKNSAGNPSLSKHELIILGMTPIL